MSSANQIWAVGRVVTLAGEKFAVMAAVVDADDFAPNSFVLAARRDASLYRFFPHRGIDKGLERVMPARAVASRQDRSPDLGYRARKGSSTMRRVTRFPVRRKQAPGPKSATPMVAR